MTDHQILLATLVVTILGTIGGLYLSYRGNQHFANQNKIMVSQGGGQMSEQYRPPKWPILTMVALVLLVWLAAGVDIYVRANSGPPPETFLAWGGGEVGQCYSVIDGSQLTRWETGYRVIIVCGVPDPHIDRFRDPNVTISSPYTIRPEAISISTPFSNEMAQKVSKVLKTIAKTLPKAPLITFSTWFQVAVIPESCSTADIHQLADISKCGGMVFPVIRTGAETVPYPSIK